MLARTIGRLVIKKKKNLPMSTKFNNNFIKTDRQLSFTLASIIDNIVTIDTTPVAMSNNIILDFNHIKHAT